jgi:hypothetical protein
MVKLTTVACFALASLMTPCRQLQTQTYYQGSYSLALIDSSKVPQFLPGLIPGEGSALTDMNIELLPQRRLRGLVIVVYTDSGSVTDTISVAGTWVVRHYQLTLTYHWSDLKWGKEGHERVVGQIGKGGFTLPRFAGFGRAYFRRPVTMAFRHN